MKIKKYCILFKNASKSIKREIGICVRQIATAVKTWVGFIKKSSAVKFYVLIRTFDRVMDHLKS
jgi:hypothetical protein